MAKPNDMVRYSAQLIDAKRYMGFAYMALDECRQEARAQGNEGAETLATNLQKMLMAMIEIVTPATQAAEKYLEVHRDLPSQN